ncbi:carboxypeptidase-like regulatory domain-containing protein [Parapedobacter sp. ISTM3]|uniref:CarboxypepD_reg-like domain-containing protein n=1 Tax=Parapedobacter luteus TaxID=623280 RepID=A0A1T5EP34_9SPHI|nr:MULTISPECIES: carboxypeptidase-like regulatory domain-containing protein [Parapedobacter]MBK1441243.1 carboxypeptidase-like regulatory domain-containing protein [Parapedobacter sp. ISTM3]SKB85733.1 CarboxypepD_reg-like domain-containing protein [Parapedobacter luteus]
MEITMSRRTKIALIASVWLLPFWLYAQESGIIRGIVVEAGTSKRIGNVTIVNQRTGQSTASSSLGTFEINASVGDTLIANSMGYQSMTTEVKTLSDILIDMRPGSIMLEQVDVNRMSKEAELRDAMRSYRKQGVYYDGKPPALAYIFNPITSLYELLGRTPRNARRFGNYMEKELEETEVDRKFSRSKIRELTGLDGDDLTNFMIWYRPSFEKAQYWGEYDITAYIVDSFKQFDRDGRPAAPKLPKLEANPVK